MGKRTKRYIMVVILAAMFVFWYIVTRPGFAVLDWLSNAQESKSNADSSLLRKAAGSRTFDTSSSGRISDKFILDTSGTYQVWRWISENVHSISPSLLTLVTHCSPTHLHLIPELVRRWHAPISIAVFVPSEMLAGLDRLVAGMQECGELVADFVSFHAVSPLEGSQYGVADRRKSSYRSGGKCNGSMPVENALLFEFQSDTAKNYDSNIPYPNNLLRNVARRFSDSPFHFAIDIDMVPSTNLHEEFIGFIKKHYLAKSSSGSHVSAISFSSMVAFDKELFVVPAFEISRVASTLPETKAELLKMVDGLVARPFYFEMCWKCQKTTDYSRWGRITGSQMEATYEADWQDPWEPFFISHRDSPFYDERFKQYGFNRISQACELHVAGYKFFVLSNAFLLHRGFKVPEAFHRAKAEELSRNRHLYSVFKQELTEKYPDSQLRC